MRPLDAAGPARPEFVPPMLLGSPEGEGWVRLSALADTRSGALDRALEAMASVRGYRDPRAIGGGFALITSAALAEPVFRAAVGMPPPVLVPERTWWQMKPSANVTAVAVEGQPDVRPASLIGDVLHVALDGLYAGIHAQTGFPVRAQWSLLASAVGHWLLDLFPRDHARAVSIAEAILASDPMLGKVRPRVTWLEVDGEPCAFTTRRVCCFNYLGRNGEYCSSQCPIVQHKERVADAHRHLTETRRSA